jgi:hypothetical protein
MSRRGLCESKTTAIIFVQTALRLRRSLYFNISAQKK